ncbi:hypothetical protein AUJ13_01275 [Candidatus Micrarchaeota archaeon CG1_02_49_24]|nr:MAG: hypothetical protein AUJ13_01275 [Candidatus Micrarchaeota archaeon CG1_02_49_24]
MSSMTTVQINKEVLSALKEIKEYPRQTYNELITHLIKLRAKIKLRNQYDEFLHMIQQQKMSELWDNEEDEVWENA